MEYDAYIDELVALREKYPDWEGNDQAYDYGFVL